MKIKNTDILDYEIANSIFAPMASGKFLRNLFSDYYARKVNRKYAKYEEFLIMREFYKKYKDEN